MIIIPAIDLLGGKVVRLLKGQRENATIYSNDPLSVAQRFIACKAQLIHVVDLDAAFGTGDNQKLIEEMLVSGLPLQVGGGIRTLEKAERLVTMGARRIVIGTKALDEQFLTEVVRQFSERIAVGVDVLEGQFMKAGWRENSNRNALEIIAHFVDCGVQWIIYTDISRDGTLSGVNIEQIVLLEKYSRLRCIVSGGIHSLEDLELLTHRTSFLYGAIVGKALYEGTLDLKTAISRLERQKKQ